MKPFLLLATRTHDVAADAEYRAVARHAGLELSDLKRIRVEAGPLPEINLDDYSGVFLGGSQFSVTDTNKTEQQKRTENDITALIAEVVAADKPFFGMCYGIGAVTSYLGGLVDHIYSEPVGATTITINEKGKTDPITVGVPTKFDAFVGHKEACNTAPNGATVLAEGQACPVQMYKVKDNIYVTQFHPELDTDDLIERMHIYQNAGYFDPSELDSLVDMARNSQVSGIQHQILKNFTNRYII
ncbi:MAG: glutamine amidotransferase [Actinomycetales bacterium]|nr:MAG: glutamine amidotransferase [Actinomycetales bacterium]